MGMQMLAPYPMMPLANSGYNGYPGPGNQMVVSGQQPQPQNKHRRFRRRYYQINRKYNCTFPGCSKSYGLLNHLNTHIVTKKHGQRKSKADFRTEKDEKDEQSKDQVKDPLAKGLEDQLAKADDIDVDNDVSSSTSTTTPTTDVNTGDHDSHDSMSRSETFSENSQNVTSNANAVAGSVGSTNIPDDTSGTKSYASKAKVASDDAAPESVSAATRGDTKIARDNKIAPPSLQWASGLAPLTLPSISAQTENGPIKLPSLPSVIGGQTPLP